MGAAGAPNMELQASLWFLYSSRMTLQRKFHVHPLRRFPTRKVLCAGPAALLACAALAQTASECSTLDDSLRLACYDRVFPRTVKDPSGEPELTTAPRPEPGEPRAAGRASAVLQNTWELTSSAKRGTFALRTYRPNYALAADWTSNINQSPASPTHAATQDGRKLKPVEAKFQVSLRSKIAEGLLLPNADLWFAYTQRSMWQVWNPKESSPFRSTDYQPEAIYTIPVTGWLGQWPGDVKFEMVQLGVAHQSNGQADPLSRSWNRVYASASLTRGDFALTATFNHRLHEKLANDDNPDLTRYIGNTELRGTWLPGVAATSVTWRTHNKTLDKGSVQLDWSYPIVRTQPQGLRWYVQAFSGYGETLLDYNHRQNRIGFGLTLFQL